jgi:hypothetical protein
VQFRLQLHFPVNDPVGCIEHMAVRRISRRVAF